MTLAHVGLREGSASDFSAIMTLFDDAVTWLVAKGRSAQCGSEPWSNDDAMVGFVQKLVESETTIIAENDGNVVGAAIYGPNRMPYTPAEIYFNLLITSPEVHGGCVGASLLELIRAETQRLGISSLRVDCWPGRDRKLVSYYERAGFTPTAEIPVSNTSVQIFEQPLEHMSS